jgi:hypothetical protein
MKFKDGLGASLLMQAVNILGDDRREFPLPFPASQNLVGNIGFKTQGQHLFPVEIEEVFRLALIEAMGDNHFRRILKFLPVQAIYAAEVRNSGFGTNASTTEEDDAIAFFDPLLQGFQIFHTLTSLVI